MERSPFESAATAVQDWLDRGPGSAWAKRDALLRADAGFAWDVELRDDALPIRAVRIVLPPDFPASTCDLFVDKSSFLKLPHVEADGHVCIGLASIPEDYSDPVAAVMRALIALTEQLLGPATDPQWVQQQFHEERTSYWAQLCIGRRKARDRRPVAARTYVDVGELNRWSSGSIAAYIPAGCKHRNYSLQVAANADPNELAVRHQWADGMMVRGDALFVRLDPDMPWTPATWPQTFQALDALVGAVTDRECSLAHWVNGVGWSDDPVPRGSKKGQRRKKRLARGPDVPAGQRPLLVVLVQDGAMFGYQLYGSAMPSLQPPSIEPVPITRIDPDWALARDHNLDVLHERRKKRVLLLGAGSLGSPLASTLARAGVGHLDIVDAQQMEAENTSRHELGVSSVGRTKAPELARQLRKEVPGLAVNGYWGDVATWTSKNCVPGTYDLVVECTAESSVRTFLSHTRMALFGNVPIIHAWTEPLCSAGHVVLSQAVVPWPDDDPADSLVNASDLSAADTRVAPPACSGGFHPYGAADIEQVAAFAAERVIAVLDSMELPSTVWSWVRSSAFFAQLPVQVAKRSIVPTSSSAHDSATVTRDLAEVLLRT